MGATEPRSLSSLDSASNRHRAALCFALSCLMAATVAAVAACGPSPPSPRPMAVIGDVAIGVEVAGTPTERAKGLSERESIAPMSGMLFVSATGRAPSLWMKGMRFPLDFIWIGEDCTVVDTTTNVRHPEPDTPDSDLPGYASEAPAAYVLEINAGEVERLGVLVGDTVRFSQITAEGADC